MTKFSQYYHSAARNAVSTVVIVLCVLMRLKAFATVFMDDVLIK
ncbi:MULTISPECIES: hypothetical protein [Bartonella]|nr:MULTISPECIES: hypothetical protein [Bartonella]